MLRHRRGVVLRGTAAETLARARELTAGLEVLWVSPRREPGATLPARVRTLLGRAFDAIVLDLAEGLDPDVLGQCEGMIRGGGALVLRVPPSPPLAMRAPLAVAPYREDDVGMRLWARFERLAADLGEGGPLALAPVREHRGTDGQARAVARITEVLASTAPAMIALLSDRGRGKSSALGLALAALPGARAAIVAEDEHAALEVRRFAPAAIPFVPAAELAREPRALDVIVIDEAARIAVPALERIARGHPRARIALASTARGYEGTGRGFVLRFLAWARAQPRGLETISLTEPIRWGPGDPLERFVHRALALDAEPAQDLAPLDPARIEHAILDRDVLSRDERLLGELFGLLVHAHYRTSPRDLHRMLDAPNLAVHALLQEGRVLAASIVAREGGLDRAACEALARGAGRIRGHALPDTLITHAARPDAGELAMIRSVRIAVHPDLRRRGLAQRLVRDVHASYAPDLFGTMFGATPELIAFRRRVGYELVRVGASRGARSGEPAAVMLAPVSERAAALVRGLRVDLARDLPLQLELLEAEGALDPALAPALARGLPTPAPLTAEERRAIALRYLASPQPFDAAAAAITAEVEARAADLARLAPRERALIELRVRRRLPWAHVAREAGFPTVAAAMRALRPAIARLLDQ